MAEGLDGKVVIITGASSGIGAATARALGPLGAKLVVTARSTDRIEALATEVGNDALAITADVTDMTQVQGIVDTTIERFGRVDAMLANAGIYIPGDFDTGDPAAYSNLMRVNIDGIMNSTYAVLAQMKRQQSGDIIITSSISGFVDIHWEPVYSASKHAASGFVHTVRRQVSGDGIRVGSVAPGQVANELWGITDPDDIDRKSFEQREFLRSEDVANAVVFMLSQPRHVTIRDLVILPANQDI